jgi:hypothetical protein
MTARDAIERLRKVAVPFHGDGVYCDGCGKMQTRCDCGWIALQHLPALLDVAEAAELIVGLEGTPPLITKLLNKALARLAATQKETDKLITKLLNKALARLAATQKETDK